MKMASSIESMDRDYYLRGQALKKQMVINRILVHDSHDKKAIAKMEKKDESR